MADRATQAATQTRGGGPGAAEVSEGVGQAAAQSQSSELLGEGGTAAAAPSDPGAAQANEINQAPADPAGGGAAAGGAGPAAAPAGAGDLYEVQRGDTLWKIAANHYGDGLLWRGIYAANRAVIGRDANVIRPGQQLRLPDLATIINTCDHRRTVQIAFGKYWNVSVESEPGAANVPVDTFRRVHSELLLLPPAHVQGTWSRLLHLNDSAGAWFDSSDNTFGLGEDAATTPDQQFGTAPMALTEDLAVGATVLHLDATALIGPGVTVTVGDGETADTVEITAVNDERTEFTVTPALTHAHSAGEQVINGANAARAVVWLEAVVRHELAHAIDGPVVDTTGFTQGLGDWHTTTSFDDWIARMSAPWATNDGAVISDAEKAQIQTVIDGLRTAPTNQGLDNGLAPDHPIIKYWASQVPVIEAAKPMAAHGSAYWQSSQEFFGNNGRFFTINDYYSEFHSYNNQVQFNQVRQYATFSPAEFFAEVYTVYYEEAADPAATPGALVPVGAWKTWFDANVHPAGGAPAAAGGGGAPSPVTGMRAGKAQA